MRERFNSISAIWKSDKKSVEECSKSVCDFLLLLKNHNENLFGKWYEKSRSKKKALENQIEIEQDHFYEALKKNWDKKFTDLGARISYWTGHKDEDQAGEISFNIGAYGEKSFNKNSCVITLPEKYNYYEHEENKEALMKLMLDYWKPDKVLINGEIIESFRGSGLD